MHDVGMVIIIEDDRDKACAKLKRLDGYSRSVRDCI